MRLTVRLYTRARDFFTAIPPSLLTLTFTLDLSRDPVGFADSSPQMPSPRGWRGRYPQHTPQCAASSQLRQPQQKQARESLGSVAFPGPQMRLKKLRSPEEQHQEVSICISSGPDLCFLSYPTFTFFITVPSFLPSCLSSSGLGILLQNLSPSACLCVCHLTRVMCKYSSLVYC